VCVGFTIKHDRGLNRSAGQRREKGKLERKYARFCLVL